MKLFISMNGNRKKVILCFLLILTAALSFQCVKAPLEPKAPQWTVPLNIGLIDRTFTFGQMIEKDPKFITDSTTSTLEYRPTSVVNKPSSIDLPELTPKPSSVSNKLGLVPLNVPTVPDINLNFKNLAGVDPPALPYPGPDTTFLLNNILLNPGATYDYVVFEDGVMTLKITNNFPFGISFTSPGVQLINVDQGGAVVATFQFTTIASNSSDTKQAIVSGKLMSANLRMQSSVHTVGINGKTITSTQNLVSHLTIGGTGGGVATLSSAKVQLTADYPVGSIPDSAVQLIDDSTKIKRAEFKDGKFQIKITNAIATSIVVDFKLSEFVDRVTGAVFKLKDDLTGSISGIIQPNSTFIQTVNMKDYAIQSQLDTVIGGRTDTLSVPNVHFSISIKTLGATNQKVIIAKTDSVRVDVTPQINLLGRPTYVLSIVTGKVKPTPVKLDQSLDAAIGDIGNKFTADSIKFDSVSITLKILSTGSFPTDLTMRIVGLDKTGRRVDSLTARDQLPGGGTTDTLRINPRVTKNIVFNKATRDSSGHGIDEFLSSFFAGGSGSLPQKFLVVGQAIIDPKNYYQVPQNTGTVKAGDSVYTSVEFLFPVRVGIINGTYRDTISISDTSGNKIDKKNLTQIDNGKVTFTISNAFPFQLDVQADLLPGRLSDRSKPDTTVLFSLPARPGKITADSGRYGVDPNGKLGLTAKIIPLSTDDVDKINPANFMAVNIKLNTAGAIDPHVSNKAVEFKKSYRVQLKAYLSVQYNVNFDKLK